MNVTDTQTHKQIRVGHGLDSSMDWIWIGLGRYVGGIAWIGLD